MTEMYVLFRIPKSILNDNERQRRVYTAEGIAPAVLSRIDQAKTLVVVKNGSSLHIDSSICKSQKIQSK